MVKFVRGSLPWEALSGRTKSHIRQRIKEKKRTWTAAGLCSGYPQPLQRFVDHCLSLQWSEEPNYEFLRQQLYDMARLPDVVAPETKRC